MPFGRGWFGRGGGWGRGNPYPFCRFSPWLPRRWWAYGAGYYPAMPRAPYAAGGYYGTPPTAYGAGGRGMAPPYHPAGWYSW
jgi:hypothetical protein